jgi:hypothetical protein
LETRNSHGLDQFCATLRERERLSILDLSAASQHTVSFITGQGHRLYAEDFLLQLERAFGAVDCYEKQEDPDKASAFLDASFNFPANHFDAALIWDSLEFLVPSVLEKVMRRLHRVMRPEGTLFAVFHAAERAEAVATYSYRISNSRTMLLVPRGQCRPAQLFNNRSLEKLFQDFESVKFFLARDHLREVIVRR